MKKKIVRWLILFCTVAPLYAIAQPTPGRAAGQESIIFLLLKMTKDSITGIDSLQLVEKVRSPGQIKKMPAAPPGLTRLPYLSLVFYRGAAPLDSVRYGYPLRERLQNTRENVQGYKDIEIKSMEFFFRFQQNRADLLEIYKVDNRNKIKLLAIDLR